MTRINVAIPVENLTDEHLKGEHREIKRICNNFKLRKKRNKFDDIPKQFTLNTGHVIFFIDKPDYTKLRYDHLYKECLKRGFNISNFSENWDIYNGFLLKKDYIPTDRDKQLIIERITERILSKPDYFWHYKGERISNQKAIELLKR